jgi:hypothetical protein
MKAYNEPAASKMIMRFDNELKRLLANDLKTFMSRNPFLMRKKQALANTLSVA